MTTEIALKDSTANPLEYWQASALSAQELLPRAMQTKDFTVLRKNLSAVELYCRVRKQIGEFVQFSFEDSLAEDYDPFEEVQVVRAEVDAVVASAKSLKLVSTTVEKKPKYTRDEEIMKLFHSGERAAFIAEKMRVSANTVYRVIRLNA